MDIEGGEVLALPGMRRLLVEARPLILLELHGPEAARLVWDTLSAAGYRLCQMAPGYPQILSLDALDWKAYLVAMPELKEDECHPPISRPVSHPAARPARLPRSVLRGAGICLHRRFEPVRRPAFAGRADRLSSTSANCAASPGPQPAPLRPAFPLLPMLARRHHRVAGELAASGLDRGSQPALPQHAGCRALDAHPQPDRLGMGAGRACNQWNTVWLAAPLAPDFLKIPGRHDRLQPARRVGIPCIGLSGRAGLRCAQRGRPAPAQAASRAPGSLREAAGGALRRAFAGT